MLHCSRESFFYFFWVAHVRRHSESLAAILINALGGWLQVLQFTTHKRNTGARFGKCTRHASGDSCATAGDEGNAPFQDSVDKDWVISGWLICHSWFSVIRFRAVCKFSRYTQSLFQGESSLVQRFSDNHTIDKRFVCISELFDVVQTRYSAGSCHSYLRRSSHLTCLLYVESGEHTITCDVRINNSLNTKISDRTCKL